MRYEELATALGAQADSAGTLLDGRRGRSGESMRRDAEPNAIDCLVTERLASLETERGRTPDAGLGAVKSGAAAGLLCALAMPGKRVLATRSVDACVMETVSFAKWLGLRTAVPGLVGIASDGRTVRLAELRGKVVLVNFWAPWYPHCKQEMTWFAEMQRDMGGAGLVVM